MKRKKKVIEDIEDIDPVSGVTANQLYNQCVYLVGTFKAAFTLTEEEKLTAISDAMIGVLNLMEKGVVDKYHYEKFKGYLFTSIKNSIFKMHNDRNRKFNIITRKAFEYDEAINEDFDKYDGFEFIEEEIDKKQKEEKLKQILEAVKTLSTIEQQMMEDYLNGERITNISRKYGVTKQWYHQLLAKVHNAIQNKRRKVVTREDVLNKLEDKSKSPSREFEYNLFIQMPPKKDKKTKMNWKFVKKMESSKFVALKTKDQFQYLISLGYQIKAVCTFMGMDYKKYYSGTYNRRHRLKYAFFERDNYLSLTQIRKNFFVPTSIKNLQEWLKERGIEPVLTRPVNLGLYNVNAAYFDPKQIESIGWPSKTK